jgi:phage gpG-like protein
MASGGFSIRVTKDDLSRRLRALLSGVREPTPILRAMGTELVSITKRAFRDASLRQAQWPSKRGGGESTLIQKGMLLSSIRITNLTGHEVTIGTDRQYGAIHQLGGIIKPVKGKALVFTIGGKTIFSKSVKIPPRPYFPFTSSGALAPLAEKPLAAVVVAAMDQLAGGK